MHKIQINARVHHTGHGNGTVVGYNTKTTTNPKALQQFMELPHDKMKPGLSEVVANGLVYGLYSSERFPYIVKFDHEANDQTKPSYTDVYSDHDLEELHTVETD